MNQARKQKLEQVIKDAKSEISDINRDEKAEILVDNVIILDSRYAKVFSEDGSKTYNIDYILQTCDCKDEYFRGRKCKHIRAVSIVWYQMDESYQAEMERKAKIDAVVIENTQGLIRKDLLLNE